MQCQKFHLKNTLRIAARETWLFCSTVSSKLKATKRVEIRFYENDAYMARVLEVADSSRVGRAVMPSGGELSLSE